MIHTSILTNQRPLVSIIFLCALCIHGVKSILIEKPPSRLPLSPRNTSEVEASRLIEVASERSGLSPPPSLLKTVSVHNRYTPAVKFRKGNNVNNNNNKENAELVSDRRKQPHGHQRTQSAKVISPSKAAQTDVSLPRSMLYFLCPYV